MKTLVKTVGVALAFLFVTSPLVSAASSVNTDVVSSVTTLNFCLSGC